MKPTVKSPRPASPAAYHALSQSDLNFIARHAKRIAKALRHKYQDEGYDRAAHNRVRIPEKPTAELIPNIAIHFLRDQPDREYKHEAILSLDFTVIKPLTKRELARLGLEKDPDVRERQLIIRPTLIRPGFMEEQLPEIRMSTAPKAAIALYDTLRASTLIETPGMIYTPIGMREIRTPQRPPSRTAVRTASKMPVPELDKQQSHFVGQAMKKFRENFTKRYGHVFDEIDFWADTLDKTVQLTLKANKEFAGKNPYVQLIGDFELIWRNEGEHATALEFTLRRGLLTRKFETAAGPALFEPIDLLKRREASIDIFNMLAAAERISTDHVKEFLAVETRRAARIHPRTRVAGHRTTRRITSENERSTVRHGFTANAEGPAPESIPYAPLNATQKKALKAQGETPATMATSARIIHRAPEMV